MSYRRETRTRRSRRSGITGFLEDLLDDTKVFLDDVLDRDDGEDSQEVSELRADLNRLAEQVARLATAQEGILTQRELDHSGT
jgi:hypothetical protein